MGRVSVANLRAFTRALLCKTRQRSACIMHQAGAKVCKPSRPRSVLNSPALSSSQGIVLIDEFEILGVLTQEPASAVIGHNISTESALLSPRGCHSRPLYMFKALTELVLQPQFLWQTWKAHRPPQSEQPVIAAQTPSLCTTLVHLSPSQPVFAIVTPLVM